jgi:hypothetical protein
MCLHNLSIRAKSVLFMSIFYFVFLDNDNFKIILRHGFSQSNFSHFSIIRL